MWVWRIIKEVLYDLFVETWVVGLTALTLLVFYGINFFESFKALGHILIGLFVLAIFAAVIIYIIYWYFSRRHYILGSAAILVCLAVLYVTCIEPYI